MLKVTRMLLPGPLLSALPHPFTAPSVSLLLLFQGTVKADLYFKWQLWPVTRRSEGLQWAQPYHATRPGSRKQCHPRALPRSRSMATGFGCSSITFKSNWFSKRGSRSLQFCLPGLDLELLPHQELLPWWTPFQQKGAQLWLNGSFLATQPPHCPRTIHRVSTTRRFLTWMYIKSLIAGLESCSGHVELGRIRALTYGTGASSP